MSGRTMTAGQVVLRRRVVLAVLISVVVGLGSVMPAQQAAADAAFRWRPRRGRQARSPPTSPTASRAR